MTQEGRWEAVSRQRRAGAASPSRKDPGMSHCLLWDCAPILHPMAWQLSLPSALAAECFGRENATGEDK